ncbi:SKN1 [Candida pseudojiufengensis]|uniref:SKN1 n=1 Tax=Candida pseudojiufengensis TaxID=497109 RepID=UPI0022246FFC|nr:SKN1 [Candida pseudojiufengensis]KAI5967831.1 SKN1 [Candida pseudojiufengensis]
MKRNLTNQNKKPPTINLINSEGQYDNDYNNNNTQYLNRNNSDEESYIRPHAPSNPFVASEENIDNIHTNEHYSPQQSSSDSDSYNNRLGLRSDTDNQNLSHDNSFVFNDSHRSEYIPTNNESSQSMYSNQSPILPGNQSFQPLLGNNYNRINNPIYPSSINQQEQQHNNNSKNLGQYQEYPSSTPTIPAYDRYPKQFSYLSNQHSTSSLLNQDNHSFNTSSSSPPNSSTLNNNYDDFSPFGGYPESQFPLSIDEKEPDDYLHNPDPVIDSEYNKNRFIYDLKNMDRRSLSGLLAFIALLIIALCIFILLPVLTFTNVSSPYRPQVYEILTDYSYPMLSAIRQSLVDPDTPEYALTNVGQDGRTWKLVFSDEFNAEGRTFYDGDDQFFTAPDFHYAATQDLEWYDPDAATTENGTLVLQLDAFKNHGLFYRSGMVQSWNKMCFTQGKLEFSAMLPGYGNISGLWPGLWSMGNLGRPGYLASTEGVWPYTYDTCDAGITPNQSSPDGISYLPGQRLNSCTCPGESHPNPGKGRGAPEIDALEGEIHGVIGRVSQSLQIAPYDIWYMPDYDFIEIYNASVTLMNTYAGGPFQQAVSGVSMLNTTWYQFGDHEHNFQKFGYEYLNDDDTGYITWFVGDNPTFTMKSTALHPNGNVGWRQVPKEPISIIMNLGVSNSWAYIDWPSLVFPSRMRVDYVRVYQPEDEINMGCDPDDFPTANYIEQHKNIYYNMNLTTFESGGYTFPKNKLTGC